MSTYATTDRGMDLLAQHHALNHHGLHYGISDDAYFAYEAANNSSLTHLKRSPAHMIEARENPPTSPAFKLGSAAHACLLQPDVFDAEYARAPEGDRRTKAVKEEILRLQETYDLDKILSPGDYAACMGIRTALFSGDHECARTLLTSSGHSEVVARWAEKGVECKAKIDRLPDDSGLIVDLKTTMDASPKAFGKSLYAYGYHRQGAFYLRGVNACLERRIGFVIVAVEKKPPYGIGVYRLTEAALDAGSLEVDKLLDLYRETTVAEGWHQTYTDDIVELDLPPWAYAEADDLLEKG